MKIQLIRHATLLLFLNNKKILIDPMLSPAESMSPIPNVPNQNFNPLVELPVNIDTLVDCDAILVTHTHRDHFDDAATKLLPKNIPVLCQPEDEIIIRSHGFNEVYPIVSSHVWNDITFNRTGGRHGHGEMADKMAPVSGFVISFAKESPIYIAGDTILCEEVEESIEKYKPKIVVCNCGAAQFSSGQPITMTTKDIHDLCSRFTNIKIVAIHMEAWNHCRLSRKDLHHYVKINNIDNYVSIPEDGEILSF